MEAVGEGGGGASSWTEDNGVCLSHEGTAVRRRLEGGMFEVEGDWARLSCLTDSWSDKSAIEPTEVSGDPSRDTIVKILTVLVMFKALRNGRFAITERSEGS